MHAIDRRIAKARRIFSRHRGMLRAGNAIRLGIHPRTLYALRDAGEIERVARGLYRLSTAPPLSNPDLAPIAIRVPRAVICLISALAHHRLTTQVPRVIDIALPSHGQIPKLGGVPLRVFRYPESSLRVGVMSWGCHCAGGRSALSSPRKCSRAAWSSGILEDARSRLRPHRRRCNRG